MPKDMKKKKTKQAVGNDAGNMKKIKGNTSLER